MKEFKLTKAQRAKLSNKKHQKELIAQLAADEERQAHIKWCKEKAIATIKAGDPKGALLSFVYDMRLKHVTNRHIALFLIPELSRKGELNTSKQIQEFIEGFN